MITKCMIVFLGIGEVLLDKIPTARTVVNKLDMIDNTFRNFEMEVLAGDKDLITETKEHGHTYKLDFSKVYWNTRLCKSPSRYCVHIYTVKPAGTDSWGCP